MFRNKYILKTPISFVMPVRLNPAITVQVLVFTFCSGNTWVETLIYIPGRRQGDLGSRRYVVSGFGNIFRMNNTVTSLLYGYYLVVTRTYTILDNTQVSKLQYLVQR
jgi:hypothetical protein